MRDNKAEAERSADRLEKMRCEVRKMVRKTTHFNDSLANTVDHFGEIKEQTARK